jgi:hypothetical protein
MDYGLIVALVIIVGAAGGFVVLARALFHNVRDASRTKEYWRAQRDKPCRDFQECLSQCAKAESAVRDVTELCASRCRSLDNSHVCASG